MLNNKSLSYGYKNVITMVLVFAQSEAGRVLFTMICGIVIISVVSGFVLILALLADFPFIYFGSCNCTSLE